MWNVTSRFNLPEDWATYVDSKGEKKVPVMLHRALFGSIERFIGILIENYAGKLPMWLSPVQVMVLPISEENNAYAKRCLKIYLKRYKMRSGFKKSKN